jgi:hypothetical protein
VNLLKRIERAVDYPEVRLGLWLVWFFAGIPCVFAVYTGFLFGVAGFTTAVNHGDLGFLAGVLALASAGLFGLIAAAVRLANTTDSASWTRGRHRFTLAGLIAGLLAALGPATMAFSAPLSTWTVLLLAPLCLGMVLLLATITIGRVD